MRVAFEGQLWKVVMHVTIYSSIASVQKKVQPMSTVNLNNSAFQNPSLVEYHILFFTYYFLAKLNTIPLENIYKDFNIVLLSPCTFDNYYYHKLPGFSTHPGVLGLHVLSCWQVTWAEPLRIYPFWHPNITLEPRGCIPLPETSRPFCGGLGTSQCTETK